MLLHQHTQAQINKINVSVRGEEEDFNCSQKVLGTSCSRWHNIIAKSLTNTHTGAHMPAHTYLHANLHLHCSSVTSHLPRNY